MCSLDKCDHGREGEWMCVESREVEGYLGGISDLELSFSYAIMYTKALNHQKSTPEVNTQ